MSLRICGFAICVSTFEPKIRIRTQYQWFEPIPFVPSYWFLKDAWMRTTKQYWNAQILLSLCTYKTQNTVLMESIYTIIEKYIEKKIVVCLCTKCSCLDLRHLIVYMLSINTVFCVLEVHKLNNIWALQYCLVVRIQASFKNQYEGAKEWVWITDIGFESGFWVLF